ncbi:unnamed protein product [Wuchereria bancrofti]|uniref:Uncharacterized protein n=1 Tax=Wuchereria bancrofti TaxID=6293 RepID=A0A3P7ECG7_WUCBA|nr:unnamed protein product [Wuchereria bancrofti]
MKITSKRERKVHDLPGTPVAKRTRNALGLMPIDKQLHISCKGTVMENFLNYAISSKNDEKSISINIISCFSKQENEEIAPMNAMKEHRERRIKMTNKTEEKVTIHY